MDPATNSMVPGGIKEQATQTLANIKSILEAGGSELGKVLKVSVFLEDGADFKVMNDVYASFFGDHKPTRTTVVAGFVKDGILIEIDCIASL
jgi:enamine deaminase RidA (YjgF/YER057c/UK114 family)